jgi:hypothetical protein
MNKEIHFYLYEPEFPIYHSWNDIRDALRFDAPIIHTTQMGRLDTCWLEFGYKIFIHESENEMYEIKLGYNNERTNREIKIYHNLFEMWQSGEFSR